MTVGIMKSFALGNVVIAPMLPGSMSALINNKLWGCRWERVRIKKKTKSGTKAEDTDEGRTSRSGGDMTSDHRAALKRVTLTPSTQEVLHFPHYSSFIFTWDHLEVIIFTVVKSGRTVQPLYQIAYCMWKVHLHSAQAAACLQLKEKKT